MQTQFSQPSVRFPIELPQYDDLPINTNDQQNIQYDYEDVLDTYDDASLIVILRLFL